MQGARYSRAFERARSASKEKRTKYGSWGARARAKRGPQHEEQQFEFETDGEKGESAIGQHQLKLGVGALERGMFGLIRTFWFFCEVQFN